MKFRPLHDRVLVERVEQEEPLAALFCRTQLKRSLWRAKLWPLAAVPKPRMVR